jgi:hypothetical protein
MLDNQFMLLITALLVFAATIGTALAISGESSATVQRERHHRLLIRQALVCSSETTRVGSKLKQ